MHEHRLRELLQDRGLQEVDIARSIGVHKNTVSNWVTGRTPVVPDRVRALADLLEVSLDDLVAAPRVAGVDDPQLVTPEAVVGLATLRRLLDNAGAIRAIHGAAPSLMEVLREAEEAVQRFGAGHDSDGPRLP